MSDSGYNEDWRAAKRWTWRFLGLGIGVWVVLFALVAVTSLALWGFGVFTSSVKGKAEAYQQKQSAVNRLFAQANFEDRFNTVTADVFAVKTNFSAYKDNPTDINETNLTGSMQVCATEVAGYNADANKYLLRDFRSVGLPQHINTAVCLKPDDPSWQALPERTETP